MEQVINGTQEFFNLMKTFGINIHYLGGETADVGDMVRTIAVNGTMTARWPKAKIISNEKISAGNVIVGLASFGKATYERAYNSGIGSNGLTSARHDILNKYYAENYKESYDNSLSDDVVYIGKNRISDMPDILSPTRTYAPLMKKLLENNFDKIYGLIHCSGGGQTKCLKYIPENVRVVKDNLFEPPQIFKEIQEASKADDGKCTRYLIWAAEWKFIQMKILPLQLYKKQHSFNIDAQIIGRVEESDKKELVIKNEKGELIF